MRNENDMEEGEEVAVAICGRGDKCSNVKRERKEERRGSERLEESGKKYGSEEEDKKGK